MEVVRVFNNNVVLARDKGGAEGTEVIVTGRGVGFQARPGQPIDPARVVRVFVPDDGRDRHSLAAMVAAIPAEHLAVTVGALESVRAELGGEPPVATLVALADHLSFAVRRAKEGVTADFPLRAEVENLYPEQLTIARRIVAYVDARVEVDIDPDEAVAVTLHLVNAASARGDLSWTYRLTEVLGQLFEVLEQFYGRSFDRHSVNTARFVTHLRYLFVRAREGKQLDDGMGALAALIRMSYPEHHTAAQRLRQVLELRLGTALTEDEVAYLTLHTARLAGE